MADLLKTLEAKLVIDQHALDDALREHPDLFYKVASELALAISNRDESKQDLDEIQAKVDLDVRSEAAKFKEKTTEKEVMSMCQIDKAVIAANDKFLKEKYNTTKWTALKDAYEQRSYALSKLVDLYLANYYSSNEDKKTGGSNLRDARASHVKEELAERRKRVSV